MQYIEECFLSNNKFKGGGMGRHTKLTSGAQGSLLVVFEEQNVPGIKQ